MGSLIGWMILKGVSPRFARPLAFVLLGLTVLALLLGGKCAYERSVIAKHDAAVNLDAAVKDRAADQASAVQQHKDDTRLTQEAGQLEKVQTNAKSDTDRRLAKHRCLRLQQAARANGLEPPTCV